MIQHLPCLLFALFAVTCSAVAQESATDEIIAALNKMERKTNVAFDGKIEKPENKDSIADDGMVVMVGHGPSTSDFDDAFELINYPQENQVLICSKTVLPGVSIFSDGTDVIKTMSFKDQAFSVEKMATDLIQFFDLNDLKRYVDRCDNATRENNAQGIRYCCELSNQLIRPTPSPGPMGIMSDKILNIQADFQLDKEGGLSELRISVTRKNPMAEIMEMGAAEIQIDGGGDDPAIQEVIDRQMSQNPVVTYVLKRRTSASDRSLKALKRIQSLLDSTDL